MFCCCAQETGQADVVVEAPGVSQAEVEPTALGQAAGADALEVEAPAASPPVPAPPPKAEERQAPQEFDAVLQRGAEQSFGWGLDTLHPDALYVDHLSGDASSPVAMYNASAPAGKDIRPGDYITRIDGASGPAQRLGELLAESLQPKVTIQRTSTFAVELTRGGKPLGLDLNYSAKGKSLYIVSVRGGAVKEQAPEVSQGQRILNVNGKTLPPKELIAALADSSLKINILRSPVV